MSLKTGKGLKVKDQVDVFLETIEDENNMPEISVQKAELQKSWDRLLKKETKVTSLKVLLSTELKVA